MLSATRFAERKLRRRLASASEDVRRRLAILAVILAAFAAGPLFIYFGVYDVAATSEHSTPVYWLLHTAMTQSVRWRAAGIKPPPISDARMSERGAILYRDHCARCHGAPGVPPGDFALGLEPAPTNLAEAARRWKPAEIYWTVKHGVKMTGMPSWDARLSEADLWSVVAFVMRLPTLSPTDYRSLAEPAIHERTSAAEAP